MFFIKFLFFFRGKIRTQMEEMQQEVEQARKSAVKEKLNF